jgi:hypothetical protein
MTPSVAPSINAWATAIFPWAPLMLRTFVARPSPLPTQSVAPQMCCACCAAMKLCAQFLLRGGVTAGHCPITPRWPSTPDNPPNWSRCGRHDCSCVTTSTHDCLPTLTPPQAPVTPRPPLPTTSSVSCLTPRPLHVPLHMIKTPELSPPSSSKTSLGQACHSQTPSQAPPPVPRAQTLQIPFSWHCPCSLLPSRSNCIRHGATIPNKATH